MTQHTSVRPPSFVAFDNDANSEGARVQRARGQNFIVDWIDTLNGFTHSMTNAEEAILVLTDAEGHVDVSGQSFEAAKRSVSILPPGDVSVTLAGSGRMVVLRSAFGTDDARQSLNQDAYDVADPKVVAPQRYDLQPGTPGFRTHPIDSVRPASGRSRLKMLQSATMSINWVEYQGPRDRTQLSPHSHEDFEQGSLAIWGDYVHHLRVPWGPDSTLWRDDLHLPAPAPSLTIFPPGLIHTTQGQGDHYHLLLDIFCPVRADFRAKGWIHNAGEYLEMVSADTASETA